MFSQVTKSTMSPGSGRWFEGLGGGVIVSAVVFVSLLLVIILFPALPHSDEPYARNVAAQWFDVSRPVLEDWALRFVISVPIFLVAGVFVGGRGKRVLSMVLFIAAAIALVTAIAAFSPSYSSPSTTTPDPL